MALKLTASGDGPLAMFVPMLGVMTGTAACTALEIPKKMRNGTARRMGTSLSWTHALDLLPDVGAIATMVSVQGATVSPKTADYSSYLSRIVVGLTVIGLTLAPGSMASPRGITP